ncbi:hypothetical protein [Polyangium aurulentum]|uniref:hypothetical protein n=1 Tax=Polyangium aurulentum TaxID=2567896 RepID=UPI0010AE149B|nr:hypothetical protein [Polyangium aurulentum]UQA62940.1 hypothetical protein E8A73_021780 [Polyangium aurulentum]
MVIGKSLLWGARVAGALIATGALTGCGIAPGDYEIYRIGLAKTTESAGCYWMPGDGDPEIPDSLASDTNNIRASGTWIIYASAEDKLYLDTGEATFEGATSDEGFTFGGKDVNVEFLGAMADSKFTTTTVTTINIVTDGDAITGTGTVKKSFKCSGASCGTEPQPACTQTTNFVGTYVEDIELKHDI